MPIDREDIMSDRAKGYDCQPLPVTLFQRSIYYIHYVSLVTPQYRIETWPFYFVRKHLSISPPDDKWPAGQAYANARLAHAGIKPP